MKKGVSPVIATVLLIAMVIIIGLIIFLWFKSIIGEESVKFGKSTELACQEVQFEASMQNNNLYVTNIGNIPIYNLKIKIIKDRGHLTKDMIEDEISSNWGLGLKQGETFSSTITDNDILSANKIVLIPILLGTVKNEEKAFTCNEEYGYEISS